MMLEVYNPWWKGREYITEDEDYKKWEESKTKWVPSLAEKISLEPYCLHFIYGPRQVGKTTLIKLLIKQLLEKVNPKAIFYFKCDQISDFKELDEVIKRYLKMKKGEKIETSYIFLDEITLPKEWYRAIKWHIDMGSFKHDVLILTGSLSMFVKGEVETFPGRRGSGKDFVMYPLSFRDFVKVVSEEIFKKMGKIETLNEEEIKRESLKTLPWINELNDAFEVYLKCGGFPLAVKSMLEEGRISTSAGDVYLSWIKGDLARLGRNESIAKRVIKAIVEKVPSPISYLSVSKEFEIKSHKTVFYYIDMLEKMHLLKVLYFIDLNKGVEVLYKQRKVHLLDPFLYHIFAFWCLTKKPEESIIVESTVAGHLSRKFNTGYWKNKKEVDIVVLGKELAGIEVKYKEKAEFAKLKAGRMRRVITLTKNKFNEEPLAIPNSVFLACLEV